MGTSHSKVVTGMYISDRIGQGYQYGQQYEIRITYWVNRIVIHKNCQCGGRVEYPNEQELLKHWKL
jgi:hypothetical protein